MRIPSPQNLGRQQITPEGTAVRTDTAAASPFRSVQQAGRAVVQEASRVQQEIRQQEIQQEGNKLYNNIYRDFAQNSRELEQQYRGEEFRVAAREYLTGLVDSAQNDSDPDTWRYIGNTIIRDSIRWDVNIDEIADKHVIEDSKASLENFLLDRQNEYIAAVGDWEERAEIESLMRANAKAQYRVLNPNEIDAMIDKNMAFMKEQAVYRDVNIEGPMFVLKNLPEYGFDEPGKNWAYNYLTREIEQEEAKARAEEARMRTEQRRAISEKYDAIELSLFQKMNSGTLTHSDINQALAQVEADEARGMEGASIQYQKFMQMQSVLDREVDDITRINSELAAGYVLDQSDTDTYYKHRKPENTVDGLINFVRETGNIPSPIRKSIDAAIKRGDVDSTMQYAGLVQRLKESGFEGNHALKSLDTKNLTFLDQFATAAQTSDYPVQQIFAEKQKQIYGFSDKQRDENRERFEQQVKPKYEELLGDVEVKKSIINPGRWFEKYLDPDVYQAKKHLFQLDGSFPEFPAEMKREIDANMEIAATGIYSEHEAEYKNALQNAILPVMNTWGMTVAFDNYSFKRYPLDQYFARVDIAEELINDDLNSLGFTSKSIPQASPGALETASFPGAVPAGVFLRPGEPQFEPVQDVELFFEDFHAEDGENYFPRYKLRATLPDGTRDFIRNPETGNLILFGGPEMNQRYEDRLRESGQEASENEGVFQDQLDQYYSNPSIMR